VTTGLPAPEGLPEYEVIVQGPRPEVMVTHGSKTFTTLFSFYLNAGGLM
jgi:hypothetical protein